MEKRTIILEVNGERREIALHPNVTLLEGLRELGRNTTTTDRARRWELSQSTV